MEIWYKITIHISSLVLHDLTLDMHTLLFLTYQMCWHKYNANVVSLYVYMFHIWNFLFFQTFCFEHFSFYLWVFSLKYQSSHDINEGCILLADIQNSQAHMTFYCADICLLGWKYLTQYRISGNDIVLCISCLFDSTNVLGQ